MTVSKTYYELENDRVRTESNLPIVNFVQPFDLIIGRHTEE